MCPFLRSHPRQTLRFREAMYTTITTTTTISLTPLAVRPGWSRRRLQTARFAILPGCAWPPPGSH